jgi:hypothetical protein
MDLEHIRLLILLPILLKSFLKDGTYTVGCIGIPTCSLVNGSDWTGKVMSQPFLQKNLIMETLKEDPTAVRKTLLTFHINQNFVGVNNLGT